MRKGLRSVVVKKKRMSGVGVFEGSVERALLPYCNFEKFCNLLVV